MQPRLVCALDGLALMCLAAVALLATALVPFGAAQSYPHGANAANKAPTVPTELLQLQALEALFDSTRGKSWVTNSNWESRDVTFFSDPCFNNFYGITCENGNIIGINLSNNRCDHMDHVVGQVPGGGGAEGSRTLSLGRVGHPLRGSLGIMRGRGCCLFNCCLKARARAAAAAMALHFL